jgi:hypothetical protein
MGAKLSGTITVHGRRKVARSAVVEVHNSAGDVLDQVQVGEDGRYIFHLAPGSWRLRVWDPHGHRGTAEVSLVEGQGRVLDIDLEEPEGGHGQ